MSNDPTMSSQQAASANGSPARRRSGSRLLARVLTVLYALVVSPIGVGLVSFGGFRWQQLLLARAAGLDGALAFLGTRQGVAATAALVGGVLLLLSVVVTGLASSAGLLSVTVLCLFPLSMSVMPQQLTWLFEVLPELLRLPAFGLFSQGVPLLLYPVMGGLGLALVIARRKPLPPLALALSGMVVLPVLLLVGSLLLMYGYAVAMHNYALTFGAEALPVPAVLALVAGMVLLWLSGAAAGTTPFAPVLPALVLLGLSAALVVPDVLQILPGLLFSRTGGAALSVLTMGGGPGLGLMLLVHAAVQLTVASRARRRLHA